MNTNFLNSSKLLSAIEMEAIQGGSSLGHLINSVPLEERYPGWIPYPKPVKPKPVPM
ncbi:hypothetical protein [Streptococcus merionis]|uniref:hypothetical protein n=1 Tax=Streptococcus merionis TaxID=400065 RepID=UPI00351970ED